MREHIADRRVLIEGVVAENLRLLLTKISILAKNKIEKSDYNRVEVKGEHAKNQRHGQ